MKKFFQNQFSTIHRFLSKHPLYSNPEKHSLGFLNVAQFLGAMNDNIYKLVLIFFLIQLEGATQANFILSAAGAVFVVPFLLFSSMAGILADRYSKNRIVIAIKAAEIGIMLLVIVSFAFQQKIAGYALLFLLASQSAMFGPSKYGIIPELVPQNKVSKANGLITSFTYLAIIAGTFLASFLTEISNRNYVLVGGFCLLLAIVGFLSSFGIKYTPPRGSNKKINWFFPKQILHTLLECRDKKHLLTAIFGSSFFLFIGAFTQLNVIPFAFQSLGLSEVYGGYLFLAAALGIASGAYFAGRVSKHHIELGLTCLGGLGISLFFILLSSSNSNITLALISLFALGFCGGNFIVPFDAYVQIFSPEENRGHVIAASNFLSFVGVLLASFAIYFFNQALGLTSATSFFIMGLLTLLCTLVLFFRLSDLFLSYTAQKILHRFLPVKTDNLHLVNKTTNPILMLEQGSFLKAWLLCGVMPNLSILIPQYKTRKFPWFQHLFYSIHRLDSPQRFETLIDKSKQFSRDGMIPCVYLLKKKPIPDTQAFSLKNIFTRKSFEVITVNFEKKVGEKGYTIYFSK